MLAFVFLLVAVSAWEVSYEGHQVVRCSYETQSQVDWLISLQNNASLDIWSIQSNFVDVHVAPKDPISELVLSTFSCQDLITDLEKHLQESLAPASGSGGFYDQYPTYDQIVQQCSDLSKQYPQLAKYELSVNQGKSIEGRNMPLLIVTGNTNATNKWTVYLQGGLHAREWIGPVTVLYLAEALLANYSTNADVKYLMDRIVFHIAPEVNPDGYVYSWTTDRNWRKNRRNNGNSYGVDLNRNFNNHWGGTGSSGVPTSDTYRGPTAASEPETQAVQGYITKLTRRLGGIDYHSYGPLVLRSWGWTTNVSSDESWLKPIGDGWSNAMKINGVTYVSQRAAELYPASGCDDDWMSDVAPQGVAMPGHGWTIELRGNSFVLPAAQILPCGQENFAGLLYWGRQLLNRFGSYPSSFLRLRQPFNIHTP